MEGGDLQWKKPRKQDSEEHLDGILSKQVNLHLKTISLYVTKVYNQVAKRYHFMVISQKKKMNDGYGNNIKNRRTQ